MPDRKRTRRDVNQVAASIVARATGQDDGEQPEPEQEKNAAAVELGRRGGLKGGPARAAKMSATERSESARAAARARWRGL